MSETETKEVETNPAMDKAMADGWRPIEDWSGDNSQWRDYKEFNDRGELMSRIQEQSSIIHSQKGQIDEIKNVINDLKSMQGKQAENEYKKIMGTLKAQKAEAIDDGNGTMVAEIDEQMDNLKDSRQAAQAPAPAATKEAATELAPEVQTWIAHPTNQWYNANSVMRHVANGLAQDISQVNPSWTPSQVLKEMDKQIRAEMPHKFSTSNVDSGDATQRPNSGNNKPKRGMKDLTEEQQQVAKRFIAQKVFKNVSEYIEQLELIGE